MCINVVGLWSGLNVVNSSGHRNGMRNGLRQFQDYIAHG
jgi:hypothetical protein